MSSLIPVELMQRLLLACLLLTLAGPAWSQAQPDRVCDMPTELTTPSEPLVHAAAALTAKNSLDILALGSGSTVGQSGGSNGPAMISHTPGKAFPYWMVDALHAMRPALRVNLTVQGGRNLTADAMLPILRQELAAHHYDVVLWQTGTVEAVQGLRPDVLRGVLQDGADAVEAANADLVLIDPQYSRFLRANADLSPYETVMAQTAITPAVTLFHRFDLTQGWVNSGQIDVERVGREQRDTTIELLHDCLGQAIARYLLAGSTEH
jgi:hypothetical protein